jgi:GrpB-like predicted nucleotidyltransferase (UPF0157 family)
MMVRAPGPEELPPWATAAAVIVPYDPGWTARARQFAGELTATLGPWLLRPVEHVGSTAIPGLTAKPVIDLMALVKSRTRRRPRLVPRWLSAAGSTCRRRLTTGRGGSPSCE